MLKNDFSKQVISAMGTAILMRFNEHVSSVGELSSPEAELLSDASRKFVETLSENQKIAYRELENITVSAQVVELRHYNKLGFHDGLTAGMELKSLWPLNTTFTVVPEDNPDSFEWKPNIKDIINNHTGFLDNRMHEIALSLRELESVDHDDDRVKSTAVYRLLKKELDMLSTSVMFVERVREALDY